MDIKTITAEAAQEISNMPLVQRGGIYNRFFIRLDATPAMIQQMLLETVWAKCIESLNAQNQETEPLAIEKALSLLMKQGAIKEKVIFKKDSFRIQMANGQYRAYRNGAAGTLWACPWPTVKRYVIQIGGSRFADFLLQFDTEIPEILTHVPVIIDTIRTREREEQKKEIEEELKNRVITSIIDQYLKPLGLSVKYTVGEGDVVTMDISKTLSAHLELPLCQLPEKLKDPEALMAMLKVEHQKERKPDEEFDWENAPT
jgi:hypothetical protein